MWCARFLLLVLALLPPLLRAEISVVDDSGRRVTLSRPAQRIVSLSPALTESLYAVGAGDRLVAVVEASDFPPAARHVPRLGDATGLGLEAVIARRPDLVLAWGSGTSPRLLAHLREVGLPVYVSEIRTLDGVAESLEELGALAGEAERGRAAAARFREGVSALAARSHRAAPLRAFYQVWPRPLMTVGGPHLISRVLELCGASNVFADLDALAPQVTIEAVLARDPDVIVAASTNGADDPLAQWMRWPDLRAARAGNLVSVDADLLHRPTPRLLQGASHLCRAMERIRAASGAQKR